MRPPFGQSPLAGRIGPRTEKGNEMSSEQRRFTRVPVKLRSMLYINGRPVLVADSLLNLSIGGCLMPTAVPYPSGTACQLEMALSGASEALTIYVDGEIARVGENETALRFTSIDPDSLFHLQNLIRYNTDDADAVDAEIHRHPGLL